MSVEPSDLGESGSKTSPNKKIINTISKLFIDGMGALLECWEKCTK